jgi:multidrug efflux pump subunit AcrA (membrane-fusion protein)
VVRGEDVAAGATLLVIDNPELVTELHQAEAEKLVADAELKRINVGIAFRNRRPTQGRDRSRERRPDVGTTDLQSHQPTRR